MHYAYKHENAFHFFNSNEDAQTEKGRERDGERVSRKPHDIRNNVCKLFEKSH